MTNLFRQVVLQMVPELPPEALAAFCACAHPRQLARGEHFLQAGEVSRQVAFVEKGCLRYYYLKDGKEHVGQFFFEGAWVGDYYSFLSGRPGLQYFDALEPVELLTVQKEDILRLYAQYPLLERFGRLLAEGIVIGCQRRAAALLLDSPEEAYLAMITERPKVMSRVPQHLIASYLGIAPESLSRIRRRLARQHAGPVALANS